MMRIRVRVDFGEPKPAGPVDHIAMFQMPSARPPRRWLPMLGSVAIHCALAVLLSVAADQLSNTYADDFDWTMYRVETIKLRVPEAIYYAPIRAAKLSPLRQSPDPNRESTVQGPASGRKLAQSAIPIPRGLDLPFAAGSRPDTATVLRPDALPKVQLKPVKVPALAYWARAAAEAPKPQRNEITPGRSEEATVPPRLAVPPVIDIPNRESDLAQINVAATPPSPFPALAVRPSATAPVRDQSTEARNGTFDLSMGDAANVISLAADPVRSGEVVAVAGGARGLRSPGSTQTPGAGGNAKNAATAALDKNVGGGTRASGSQQSSGPERRRSDAVPTGSPQRASTALRNGAAPVRAPAPGPNTGAEAFTRIMHPPNGTFDVVVTQLAAAADVPAAVTHLTGSPVYSVYIRVGDAKEWVLAFSLPEKESRNSPYEIYVEDAAPLDPPYPIKTTIPKAVASQTRSTPLVFYGFLTAAGAFRDMHAAAADALSAQITSVLGEWQFRPARKNSAATEIQVALIVPATDDGGRPSPSGHAF